MAPTPSPELGAKDESLALRCATITDVEAVVALEHQLFPDPWSRAMVHDELSRGDRHYVLALLGTRPVGYAGIWLRPPEAELMTIGVSLDHQGKGIGRMLLTALVAAAAGAKVNEVFLEVRADNHVAQELYESEGFARIGLRKRYYRPDGADAITMRLNMAVHGPP